MDYFLFWAKILAKRAIDLIKQSPFVFIGMIIIILAFIVGGQYTTIEINIKTAVILLFIIAVSSIVSSLKNYHTMPVLVAYSKSNLQNKNIKIRFFIKQALKNNLFFIIFGFILFTRLAKIDYNAIILAIVILIVSFVFSFFAMYLKNEYVEYVNKKIRKTAYSKSKISPFLKGVFYDYFDLDFLVMVVFCFALFVIIIGSTMNTSDIQEMENPSIILTVLAVILSLGFTGLISSIPEINWSFHSIIFPQNISRHIKKTALLMVWVFGLLFIVFIFIAMQISILALIKYLYSIAVLLLFSIYNAFTCNNSITKFTRAVLYTVLFVWISTLNFLFLILLILPLLIIALLAKNDLKEWYLK